MAVGLGVASLVLTAASSYVSYRSGKKANEAQKEGQAIDRASQEAEAIRQRRQVARKARVMRATMIQAGENTGTGGSSAESGSIASLATRQGSASAQLSYGQLTANAISGKMQEAADAQFKGQVQSAILNLGAQGASMGSSYMTNKNKQNQLNNQS